MAMDLGAVFQFYPNGKYQLEMITITALKSGFLSVLAINYPYSTEIKKHYLVIEASANNNLGIV
jgi:hypothetical protein